MTNDINHGLALLADEVEPATVDTYAVIAKARARTRNRRTTAAAFLAVVAIGALAVTSTADRPTSEAAEQPELPSQRLTAQLAAALPELLPSRWETQPRPPYDGTTMHPEPLIFSCSNESSPPLLPHVWDIQPEGTFPDGCSAAAWYRDAEGVITLMLNVRDYETEIFDSCVLPECDQWTLPDGTRVLTDVETIGVTPPGNLQQVQAQRPDGTVIHAAVTWQDDRSSPPLTLDELAKFATVFTY
jgi:hypothetical protein